MLKNTLIFLTLLAILLSPSTALADTIIPYGASIIADTTWTTAGSPYIVNPIGVVSGATLTIEPGVVVKMKSGAIMGIGGKLIVGTQAGTPVIITSENDDSVGGDTNHDGTTTPALAGDWGSIIFYEGARGDFGEVNIRYGGRLGSVLKNTGGTIQMNTASVTDNVGFGIFGLGGTTTIHNSLFARSSQASLYMTGGALRIGSTTFENITGDAIHLRGTMNFYNEGGNSTDNIENGIVFDYMSLIGDNLLSGDQLSYQINGAVSVLHGATLSCLPGTILKLGQGALVGVAGTLTLGDTNHDGTTTPVVITSIKDDTHGG